MLGEAQHDLEQIAVNRHLEAAMLQLGKAFGDGESQSAALAVPRAVAAHKALGQIFRRLGEPFGGYVTEGHIHLSARFFNRAIGARAGQRIFADVGENIVENPPQMASVGQNEGSVIRNAQNRLNPRRGEAFAVFADRLGQQLGGIGDAKLGGQCAGRRL